MGKTKIWFPWEEKLNRSKKSSQTSS
ncbi:hypothetical protein CCACVL1_15114, partial [Corchorus capsularis]